MIYSENILICIAVPLLVMLLFLRGKTRQHFMAFLLGMVMCFLSAYLNGFFANLFAYDEMATARYIAPIVEEIMKMLPIILSVLLVDTTGKECIGFAIAVGAGFATFENCCYITQNGAQLIRFILVRGLAVGIMHVLCGLIIGVGMKMAITYKSVMLPGTLGSFAFSMTVHALYNLLVSGEGVAKNVGFAVPVFLLLLIYIEREKIYRLEEQFGNER